jgi:hypothetical protein
MELADCVPADADIAPIGVWEVMQAGSFNANATIDFRRDPAAGRPHLSSDQFSGLLIATESATRVALRALAGDASSASGAVFATIAAAASTLLRDYRGNLYLSLDQAGLKRATTTFFLASSAVCFHEGSLSAQCALALADEADELPFSHQDAACLGQLANALKQLVMGSARTQARRELAAVQIDLEDPTTLEEADVTVARCAKVAIEVAEGVKLEAEVHVPILAAATAAVLAASVSPTSALDGEADHVAHVDPICFLWDSYAASVADVLTPVFSTSTDAVAAVFCPSDSPLAADDIDHATQRLEHLTTALETLYSGVAPLYGALAHPAGFLAPQSPDSCTALIPATVLKPLLKAWTTLQRRRLSVATHAAVGRDADAFTFHSVCAPTDFRSLSSPNEDPLFVLCEAERKPTAPCIVDILTVLHSVLSSAPFASTGTPPAFLGPYLASLVRSTLEMFAFRLFAAITPPGGTSPRPCLSPLFTNHQDLAAPLNRSPTSKASPSLHLLSSVPNAPRVLPHSLISKLEAARGTSTSLTAPSAKHTAGWTMPNVIDPVPAFRTALYAVNALTVAYRQVPTLAAACGLQLPDSAPAYTPDLLGPTDAAQGMFHKCRNYLEEATDRLLRAAIDEAVFVQLRPRWLRLYYPEPLSEAARLSVLLHEGLLPILEVIDSTLYPELVTGAVSAVCEAIVTALITVLVDSGPRSRRFEVTDHAIFMKDVAELRDFFDADGDGLDGKELGSLLAPLEQVISFHGRTSRALSEFIQDSGSKIIAQHCDSQHQTPRGLLPAEIALRVIASRRYTDPLVRQYLMSLKRRL